MNKNLDIRTTARAKRVFLYEVAEVMGISEPTLMRWLRVDLTDERKAAILDAIDKVAAQHAVQISATSVN